MKKVLTILTLISLFLFASCSKDENQTPKETNKLIGRWVAEAPTVGNDPYIEGSEYTFKSDGTFTGFYIELVYNGNIFIRRDKLPYSGSYKLSEDGKWLTITEQADDPDRYYIKFISDKKFTLSEFESSKQVIATYNKQ